MSGIRRRAVSGTIFALLIVSIFAIPLNIRPARAESGIWIVDDDGPADFRTIQEAINAAYAYAAYPGGESSTPTATVGTTTYVDSNVTKATYYYYVKAFDNQNPPNYSDPSNEASAVISPHIWPMFRYNAQHTGQCPYDTSKNNGTLKWKYKTDYYVYSSPAIASDGTIYVGSRDGYLYAINPDGTLKWKYQTGWYI